MFPCIFRNGFPTLAVFLVGTSICWAVEPRPSSLEAETLMCERGKLLLKDDLHQPLQSPWRVLKGKWEVVGSAIQGSELKEDQHGAVVRANVPLHNAVIQYEFLMEGAKTTTFSINDAQGHNSRVLITAAGISVRKDDHDHTGPDKAVLLQPARAPVTEGNWHTLVIELNGAEILARLDGQQTAFGSHPAIDVAKTDIGLTVAGQSVSFRNLRIWEATPRASWPETRSALTAKAAR